MFVQAVVDLNLALGQLLRVSQSGASLGWVGVQMMMMTLRRRRKNKVFSSNNMKKVLRHTVTGVGM